VGDHQGPDMIDGKINGEIRRGSTAALVLALEQAAVYEDAVLFGRVTNGEFVAGAGYARGGAVVQNIDHDQHSLLLNENGGNQAPDTKSFTKNYSLGQRQPTDLVLIPAFAKPLPIAVAPNQIRHIPIMRKSCRCRFEDLNNLTAVKFMTCPHQPI